MEDFEIPTKDVHSEDDSSEAVWFKKNFDDFEISTKDSDDRCADEDKVEREENLQTDEGLNIDVSCSSASARRVVANDNRIEKLDKQDEKSETVMDRSSTESEEAQDHRSNPGKKTPCSEEDAASNDGDASGREKKHTTHRLIGPTLKLNITSDTQHGFTVKDDKISVREREPAEVKGVSAQRDEEWFQRNLKELPTIFNLTRIHRLTTAR